MQELLGLVGLLLQARLHLEQLALVEQQLVLRLGLHQALRRLAPELLVLVGLQLRPEQFDLALPQLGLHPALQQALRQLVPEWLGLVDQQLHLAPLAREQLLAHLDLALQPVPLPPARQPNSKQATRRELHQFVIALLDHLH